MFGKKSLVTLQDDRIYLTHEESLAAFIADAKEALLVSDAVFLISFFHNRFEEFRDELENSTIPFRYYDTLHARYETVNAMGNMAVKTLLLPAQILESLPFQSDSGEKNGEITIMVSGHHPLPKQDEIITRFADALRRKTTIVYYQSFDDKLLQQFGAERLKDLMQKMGLKQGEVISHPMVTSSIKKAQEKIAEKVNSQQTAVSEEEWFTLNFISPGK